MKKFLFCLALLVCTMTFARTTNLLDKVERAFQESFPTATDIKWYKEGNLSIVRFVKDKVTSELTYDADANIIKSVRYYQEENLPPMVVCKVKAKYPGKKIFGVTEIYSENRLEYHIVLEDESRWYNIVADPYGNSLLNSKFRKA